MFPSDDLLHELLKHLTVEFELDSTKILLRSVIEENSDSTEE